MHSQGNIPPSHLSHPQSGIPQNRQPRMMPPENLDGALRYTPLTSLVPATGGETSNMM